MALAIELGDLVKSFGAVRALNGLDLDVKVGEVHGFLGPNGAGKSTTIRVLLGLLRRDSGSVRMLGCDPWKEAAALHRRIAYVPGDVSLWPNLTGGEVIDLLGRMRGGLDEKKRADLLERFELDPGKKARTYSKGNRQKVAVVAAFASDAELYLLDEPTSGLDPLMEAEFQRCVRDAKARRPHHFAMRVRIQIQNPRSGQRSHAARSRPSRNISSIGWLPGKKNSRLRTRSRARGNVGHRLASANLSAAP